MQPHGFLLVDKPAGWTSHDVVGRVRTLLRTRRVGHAGTLDPAASGVLVLGVGKATKFIDRIQHQAKQYVAHVVLGVTTSTADVDGEIETVRDIFALSIDDIARVVPEFIGHIDQVPPKYSAIKQGGVPLYRRARRGEAIEVPSRRVYVSQIHVLRYDYPDLWITVDCGPGFYVRSLARDIGDALGSGAYLHHLRRTRIGDMSLDDCWSLVDIQRDLSPSSWSNFGIHPEISYIADPTVILDVPSSAAWYHGRSVGGGSHPYRPTGVARVYRSDGHWCGIGRSIDESNVRPTQVFSAPDWESS